MSTVYRYHGFLLTLYVLLLQNGKMAFHLDRDCFVALLGSQRRWSNHPGPFYLAQEWTKSNNEGSVVSGITLSVRVLDVSGSVRYF